MKTTIRERLMSDIVPPICFHFDRPAGDGRKNGRCPVKGCSLPAIESEGKSAFNLDGARAQHRCASRVVHRLAASSARERCRQRSLGSTLSQVADKLGLHVDLQALDAALMAEAGVLDAAERRLG